MSLPPGRPPISRFRLRRASVAGSLALAALTALLGAGCGGGGTISVVPAAPAAPTFPDFSTTGIHAGIAGNQQATLIWDLSPGATSYTVYRDDFAGANHLLKAGLAQTTFTDTGLTNGKSYTYEVTASNVSGESAKSAAQTVALPVAFTFSITPSHPSLNDGQTQTFTAPVAGDGTDPAKVVFSLQDAAGKTVTDGTSGLLGPASVVSGIPTVVYTAPSPAAPQTYFVAATYGQPGDANYQTQTATVTVGAGSGAVIIPVR